MIEFTNFIRIFWHKIQFFSRQSHDKFFIQPADAAGTLIKHEKYLEIDKLTDDTKQRGIPIFTFCWRNLWIYIKTIDSFFFTDPSNSHIPSSNIETTTIINGILGIVRLVAGDFLYLIILLPVRIFLVKQAVFNFAVKLETSKDVSYF